jgi:hypothetical protein
MGELSALQENICADCPGSFWGKHSICRVHGCSIGSVQHCYEWDVHEERTLQRDYILVSAALQQMEADIKAYRWNQQRINELEQQLDRMDGDAGSPGSSMVAQYGIEATLPRSTAPEDDDDGIYERKLQRLAELKLRVTRVDQAVQIVTNSRDRAVLDGLLDELPLQTIALQIGVTTRWIREIRLRVIRTMALGNRTNSDLHIDSHKAGGMHG